MKAEKTKSGRWRCKVYCGRTSEGKIIWHSITADTKKEAERLAMSYKISDTGENITLAEAVRRYIDVSAAVLSPNTVREYKNTLRARIEPNKIGAVKLNSLNSMKLQAWVSELATELSPKTVKNIYGLVTATISMHLPEKRFRVRLPRIYAPQSYCPTADEVRTVLELSANDTDLYRAVCLAICGLRRGEIAALTASDIQNGYVNITKAVAKDENKREVIKPPKTRGSVRRVALPLFVLEAMPLKGKVISITADRLTGRFQDMMEKSGLPHFRFHDLRHFSASIASALSISAATIQANGGWSSSETMSRVYINPMADVRSIETKRLNDFLDGSFLPDKKGNTREQGGQICPMNRIIDQKQSAETTENGFILN